MEDGRRAGLPLRYGFAWKFDMSVKKVGPATDSRFNYLVCLDIVVLVCILVVAGRPDGLAITLSAIIVAIAALFYRCASGAARADVRDRDRKPGPTTRSVPADSAPDTSAKNRSWLRESD